VGSLRETIASTTSRASRSGALVTLPTERVLCRDRDIPFLVHVTELQDSKAADSTASAHRPRNPFLPPDPELVIGEVEPHHIAVLNKFNVIPEHLLIVTRGFVDQDRLLEEGDFRALATCMRDLDGLGFYNGGTIAGASQPHRHLQLVPVPLGAGPAPTPIDEVLGAPPTTGGAWSTEVLDFPHLVFPLSGRRFEPTDAAGLFERYRNGCTALGIADGRPYNLLVTRSWMLLVPRSREFWRRVSINALGFAGSLLVRDRTELGELIAAGPVNVLRSVVTDVEPP
jgi:ATP adenylyltransferase